MALGFKEKRVLQQEIQTCFDALDQKPDFKEKRSLQKRITDAFAKLEEKIEAIKNTLLDDLLAGKFIDQGPIQFIATLRRVLATINDNVAMIIEPVVAYVKKHKKEATGLRANEGMVNESANDNSFDGDAMSDEDVKRLLALLKNTPKGQSLTLNIR